MDTKRTGGCRNERDDYALCPRGRREEDSAADVEGLGYVKFDNKNEQDIFEMDNVSTRWWKQERRSKRAGYEKAVTKTAAGNLRQATDGMTWQEREGE